jgi:hypothetical protein
LCTVTSRRLRAEIESAPGAEVLLHRTEPRFVGDEDQPAVMAQVDHRGLAGDRLGQHEARFERDLRARVLGVGIAEAQDRAVLRVGHEGLVAARQLHVPVDVERQRGQVHAVGVDQLECRPGDARLDDAGQRRAPHRARTVGVLLRDVHLRRRSALARQRNVLHLQRVAGLRPAQRRRCLRVAVAMKVRPR